MGYFVIFKRFRDSIALSVKSKMLLNNLTKPPIENCNFLVANNSVTAL